MYYDCNLITDMKCCDFHSLNPTSAMKFFLVSLPRLLPGRVDTCFKLLISLLPQTSSISDAEPATNFLFDEDPVNSYEEKVVLMECVAESLQTLLAENQDSATRLRSELLKCLPEERGEVARTSLSLSRWERPRSHLRQMMNKLLRPVVEEPIQKA